MTTSPRGPIVVVSGLPGAGKSSLARQLRDVLRLAQDNPRGCLIDIWINPVRDDSGFADAMRGIDGARLATVVDWLVDQGAPRGQP